VSIERNGSRPSQRAAAEHFTGTVRLDPLFQAGPPARASGAYVTFEPCARSDWHALDGKAVEWLEKVTDEQ
jgi:hypothetical protein